ncbi:ABC transporter substrate-binding protein/permease [Fructobacillus durionis]|uniref:Amino acid ABC transporter substrate-binding protein, PAAT family (TC 3.A.1.3.-)/amino acid ABC transporter membrane protein, PAAT family (TC 3.A.1.3.-) n=1 Tax=Fructobacillus durionis TaxID=283737 RepID=A0A1I1FLU8_9LACO|nr:ABC transporter substrate-binding protein/permease [Fructobacillus durionis]SFB99982.1 amino acid ABC transporter substrate-binding protein, PAAT family (TC 3.A.1.3.-)/amino acid ABC transporter membrane protein, PAAT family (TC 3.A.1.3.-) [Fructobacillus durionis]
MKKGLLTVLVALSALFAVFGLSKETASASEPNYTITSDATYAPFDFQDKNNQYIGIDQDLLKAIAKAAGFTVTVKPMAFNAAMQSVASSQADGVIAGTTITNERKAVYDFSDPYYKTGIAWATAKNSKIKSLSDLKGKTVALKTGTAGAEYAESIKDQYGFKITYFSDSDTVYRDVINGNSVATFADMPVLQYTIKNGTALKVQNSKDPFAAGDLGFAVKKGQNAELLADFNKGLAIIKKNGTYDKIINKYLDAKAETFTGSAKDNSTVWGILKTNRSAFWSGLKQTMYLTVVGIILASLWGLLLGVMGVSKNAFVRGLSTTVIYIFRGMPMLVLAFFLYIGIPALLGTKISAWSAGILTLVLNEGAYTGAFVRGGFQSVDSGQMEAARSLGLSHGQAMRKVIIPQGLRLMVPSFINQFIITLKDTSLLSAIGILELTQTGTLIVTRNSQGFRVWAIVAMIYLVVITLLTWFSNWVEKRMNA